MNYKQMLDKLQELEARIDALEQGQHKHTQFPPTPSFITAPSWPEPPWTVTCTDNQRTYQ